MGAWARGVASFPDHICFSFFNNKRGARLISNEPRPRTFHLRRGPIRACAGSYEALRVAGSHRVGRLAFGRPYDSAPLRERCEGFSMSFWDRDVLPLPRVTRTTKSSLCSVRCKLTQSSLSRIHSQAVRVFACACLGASNTLHPRSSFCSHAGHILRLHLAFLPDRLQTSVMFACRVVLYRLVAW